MSTFPSVSLFGEILQSIAWSPDGTQLAYIHVHSNARRMEYALAVWDVAQAELVTAWALTDYPSALAWHPHDPHQLALGYPSRIDIIDPTTGTTTKAISTASLIPPLVWQPDGGQVAAATSAAKMVAVYDVAQGRRVQSLFNAGEPMVVVCWNASGLAAVSAGRGIVWDAATGQVIAQVEAQLVACEPDGTRLAYIQEGRVWLWTISADGGEE